MSRRVVHTMLRYGLVSETFVRDTIVAVEREGWESWVAAQGVEHCVPSQEATERLRLPDVSMRLYERVFDRLSLGANRPRRFASRAYLRMAEPLRPHLIHAHFGWAGADSVLAARRLRVPLLVSFHGTDLTVYPSLPDWRRAYRRLLANAERVTVVSEFLRERLLALGYDRPVELLPTGIRLERLVYRPPRPAPTDLRLAFVGRLIPCKGLDVLLRALPKLPHARLEVVGDGPERASCEALARRLGVTRRIVFRGALAHERTIRVLRDADVLVVPSRAMPDGQAEGSSVASKEGYALGLPVVATAVGGLPETVPPVLRHEIVPDNDSEALVARILALWGERGRWQQRTRQGREWVESEFSWAKLGSRLSALYSELIGGTRASPGWGGGRREALSA